MTPATIKSISDRHLDAWFAADPTTSKASLRDHVEDAITEALEAQAIEYQSGADTLRHERDEVRRQRDEAVSKFANL